MRIEELVECAKEAAYEGMESTLAELFQLSENPPTYGGEPLEMGDVIRIVIGRMYGTEYSSKQE